MYPVYISDILTRTDLLSWPRLYQISLQRGAAEQDCEFSLLTNTANTRSHTPPTVPEVSTPSATQTRLCLDGHVIRCFCLRSEWD